MFPRIERVVAEQLAKGNVVAPVGVLIGMGLDGVACCLLESHRRDRLRGWAYRTRTSMCREKIHLIEMSRQFEFRRPAETAALPSENDLLRWGWTVSSPRSPSRPHCEPHTEWSPRITSKFESSHPGRSDTNFDRQRVDSAAPSCTSVLKLLTTPSLQHGARRIAFVAAATVNHRRASGASQRSLGAPMKACFGREAYFVLTTEWRLSPGLRSFPR